MSRDAATEAIAKLCRPEIYAMSPYSSARVEGSQDASIFLDANENPYPPYPAGDDEHGMNRYPEPQPRQLVDRFAALYDVFAERIFISRGADEAIDLLLRAFCRPGKDGILITPPTFVMYETAATIQGAEVHKVPLHGSRFDLDVDAMLDVPGAKLVFVCSPNNPTGNLMRRDDVLRLARALEGKALVVVDQLYADYSGEPSLVSEVETHPNLVVLRSVSKEYSLAGERCGVTVAHPEVVRILRRVMPPYPLAVSSIRAVSAAVSEEGLAHGRANIERIVAERERVQHRLQSISAVIRVYDSDANFLLVETSDATGLTEWMQRSGIKIRNRDNEVPGTVRISIGTPHENDSMLSAFERFGATTQTD